MGTMVPLFLLFHPLLGLQLSPGWNGAEDDFLTHGDGETFDKRTWEIATLMAAFDALLLCTGPDRAGLAVLE